MSRCGQSVCRWHVGIFSLKEILGHTTLEMVNHYLHFTRSQITAQHHKYSPMDKLHGMDKPSPDVDA